jgi:hypothetical protein
VAALTAALALSGCALDACPAVGYQDTSPVRLRFLDSLPSDATVAACFGDGCDPAEVAADGDGRYAVSQPPLSRGGAFGQLTIVRVVVSANGAVIADATHDIPVRSEHTGMWGQCPGPWSYQPVKIRLD